MSRHGNAGRHVLPAAPLVELVERLGGGVAVFGHNGRRRAYSRAKAAGELGHLSADNLATAAGAHPWELWPEWFDLDALEELEEVSA